MAGVSEAKAPAKKREARDLPARELVEGVTAIVWKSGRVEITARQCVYETAKAIAVWDRDLKKRIHWIARKRVLDIERVKA